MVSSSRPPKTRRPANVAAAIKTLVASGVGIARIEIDSTGKTVIIPRTAPDARPQDDLDRELEEWEAHHGQG